MKKLVLYAVSAGLLGYVVGCSVSFDDSKMVFRCSADGECGGNGYTCVNMAYCCKPDVEKEEVVHGCDGRDNDCNGQIDEGAGTIETCNGVDDDCDGVIDNGYDLFTDPRHCGACDHPCALGQACNLSLCVARGETNCIDGLDNDGDMQADCADPDCNLQGCGMGCQCRALAKAEGNCDDAADNDGDNQIDCADSDCDGAGCGTTGCVCANMAKKETDCRDGMDNDGDMMIDCADSDCGGALCMADPSVFRCAGDLTCSCNDGGMANETGARCRDRIDNDCDGLIDCAEASCDGLSCAWDGGTSCVCTMLGGKETNCKDRFDNDNDGYTDCGDVQADGGGDCPLGTACTFLNGGGMERNGTCGSDHLCK